MSYKVLYQAGQDEIEEKKSRFIAHTLPVTSEEEAVAFLNKIKKEWNEGRIYDKGYGRMTLGIGEIVFAGGITNLTDDSD